MAECECLDLTWDSGNNPANRKWKNINISYSNRGTINRGFIQTIFSVSFDCFLSQKAGPSNVKSMYVIVREVLSFVCESLFDICTLRTINPK